MEKPGITEMLVSTCTGWVPRIWRVLLLLAVILVLGGCTAGKKWKYLPDTRAEERSIYVIAHGWHAGIALSSDDLGDELGFIKEYLRQGKYYEFGWGEADFYQADEATAYIFLKAVFWRNSSVMHLLSVPEAPAKYFSGSEVIELKLSEAGLKHLKNRLRASFKFDERNRPYPLKGGLHGESRFFKAEGYYLITHTCNRWTAKILESGGVPMDTVFTLRAASVMRQANEAQKEYSKLRPFGEEKEGHLPRVPQPSPE